MAISQGQPSMLLKHLSQLEEGQVWNFKHLWEALREVSDDQTFKAKLKLLELDRFVYS